MPANRDSSDQAREHPGLPLSTDPWESRGGTLWVVAGVCAFALAVVFHLKLDPAAARARNGAEDPPAAPSEREETQPAQAQAELSAQQGPEQTAAAEPSDSTATTPSEPMAKPKRAGKPKRASAAPQATLAEHAEPTVPAAPPPEPARASAIPDNPY